MLQHIILMKIQNSSFIISLTYLHQLIKSLIMEHFIINLIHIIMVIINLNLILQYSYFHLIKQPINLDFEKTIDIIKDFMFIIMSKIMVSIMDFVKTIILMFTMLVIMKVIIIITFILMLIILLLILNHLLITLPIITMYYHLIYILGFHLINNLPQYFYHNMLQLNIILLMVLENPYPLILLLILLFINVLKQFHFMDLIIMVMVVLFIVMVLD